MLPSVLRYHGTETPVQVGDRVEYTSLFPRRRSMGTVVTIPEATGRELAKRGKGPDDWYIRLDSGVITGWLYSPEDLQPPSRLRFISRGNDSCRISGEEIDAQDAQEEAQHGVKYDLLTGAILLVVLLVVALGWVVWRLGV